MTEDAVQQVMTDEGEVIDEPAGIPDIKSSISGTSFLLDPANLGDRLTLLVTVVCGSIGRETIKDGSRLFQKMKIERVEEANPE